jgi:hypothetical protein
MARPASEFFGRTSVTPALRSRATKFGAPISLSNCAAGRLSDCCKAVRAVTEP